MNRKPIKPSQAAILRSVQKDEQYIEKIKIDVHQLLQTMLGPRRWIHWKQSINLVTDLTYYGLTTLSGLQTLGEEYVRIVQIEGSNLKVPSFQRRLFMVLLSTSGPMMVDAAIKQLGIILADVNSLSFIPQLDGNTDLRVKMIECLPEIKSIVSLLQRLHLVVFYFFGSHYELSKRVTDVNYTAIRSWLTGNGSEMVYKLLGYMSLTQLLITILMKYYTFTSCDNDKATTTTKKTFKTKDEPSRQLSGIEEEEVEEDVELEQLEAEVPPRLKCSLCLCKRIESTATPCGHLFCWTCIHEWIESKPECPLCRLKFAPSRLVHLQN